LSSGGRTGVFVAALAIFLVALFLPGWLGAIMIIAIVAALVALMRQTWAVADGRTRTMRLIILAIMVGLAFYKATH
jgi:hypothetical protein